MSSVEAQSEIVEITVDSWTATSEWPIQKNGVVRSKSKSAANGSAIRGRRRKAGIHARSQGEKCCMKFLDAEVKIPLPFVSVIVNGGSKVEFGQLESYIENESMGRGIPEKGVFVVQLNAVNRSKAQEEASVFKCLA